MKKTTYEISELLKEKGLMNFVDILIYKIKII